MSSLSPAEMFIGAGSAVLVLADVVFGLLLDRFYAYPVAWAAAAVALVAIIAVRFLRGSLPVSYNGLLIMAGLTGGLVALRGLIEDIVFIGGRGGVSTEFLLGALGFYVGAALLAYGSWMLWRRAA